MNDIQELSGINRQIDMLEKGIVSSSSTVISLLGLDLVGIRHLKIVTTLETWLNCAELLW
jgi:hypothetical protein